MVALTIDMLLPALPAIRADFNLTDVNQGQYIISAVFAGMIVGKLLFGALSDAWGRKPAIYLGLGLFVFGSMVCYFANSFNMLLFGRLLQGIGVASPRIVCLALVRDQFEGRQMARIMSFIMMVFILVPAIAPALGQLILNFAKWRAILLVFIASGIICLLWFARRQPETLLPENRRPLAMRTIISSFREVLRYPEAVGYTLAIGFVFAGFIGYLVASQQIFDLIYQRGEQFAYYFGMLALVIGSASIVNARFVLKYGMRHLSMLALIGMVFFSVIALGLEYASSAPLAFEYFVVYCIATFFCVGILFGNLNSMALTPLGHIAGMGAAFIGAISTIISVVIGSYFGQLIEQDIKPMLFGFLVMSLASLWAFRWVSVQMRSEQT